MQRSMLILSILFLIPSLATGGELRGKITYEFLEESHPKVETIVLKCGANVYEGHPNQNGKYKISYNENAGQTCSMAVYIENAVKNIEVIIGSRSYKKIDLKIFEETGKIKIKRN